MFSANMKKAVIVDAKIIVIGDNWREVLKGLQNASIHVIGVNNPQEELFPEETPDEVVYQTIENREK